MSIERIKAALADEKNLCRSWAADEHPDDPTICADCRDSLARAALGALQGEEDVMEAAVKAHLAARHGIPDDQPHASLKGLWGPFIAEAELKAMEAAAPLLRAPLVAEVETLRGEKTTRERLYREQWERGNTAERERDAARGALADCVTQNPGWWIRAKLLLSPTDGPFSTGGGNG